MVTTVLTQVKVKNVLYTVEVMVFDDGYHIPIGYKPIPDSHIRKQIDQKIERWVGFYRKQQASS